MMARVQEAFCPVGHTRRTSFWRGSCLLLLGLSIWTYLSSSCQAGLMNLDPDTTGQYKSDLMTAWNNTTGFSQLAETHVGGTQGMLGNRFYRSYLIFDTQDADALIIGATLRLGVTYWTTSQGVTPSPGSSTELFVGLPNYSAAEIAANHNVPGDPMGMTLYNDLTSNRFGSVVVNSAPNMPGSPPGAVWYSFDLPISFISAFNQAKLNGTRYVPLSVSPRDQFTQFLTLGNNTLTYQPLLAVNTISSVPEPLAMISLGSGLVIVMLAKRKSMRR